jgi:hypothetical protein
MNPIPGQLIFIFFRTGVQIEGEVVSWSDNKSVIKSASGMSTIVIQKTLEDVMFYKFSSAKTDYEKLKEKPIKEDDDIKALAELKNELNDLERAEIKEKLTTHNADGIKKVSYGLPFVNSKIESPIECPREKTSRKSSVFSTELQGLFSKKH